MVTQNWAVEAQICKDILDKSIQKQWLLPEDLLPSPEQTNVLHVPRESGMLTEPELQITETDATGLVEAMAKGAWTAEDVTIAFLKRATIGHQLVGPLCHFANAQQTADYPSLTTPLSLWPKKRWTRPACWTLTSAALAASSAPCTGCPSP